MKWSFALLAALALPAQAAEPELWPSARRLLAAPEWLRPGQCVRYAEAAASAISTPTYYLQGEVVGSELVTRALALCPVVPGKTLAQYTRQELVRHAEAFPCVSDPARVREVRIGLVRLKVSDWETPHARSAANAGRLYRGDWLGQRLEKYQLLELEADLLGPCD